MSGEPGPRDMQEGGNQSRDDAPAPLPDSRERFWGPLFKLTGIGAVMWLAAGVALDIIDLRFRKEGSAPSDVASTCFLLVAIPVLALFWSLAPRFGVRSTTPRILAVVLASLLAFFLGIVLMATVGLTIHVALGGSL